MITNSFYFIDFLTLIHSCSECVDPIWHFNAWLVTLFIFHLFVYHRQHLKQVVQIKGTSYDLVQDLLNEQSKSNWSAPLIQ